MKKSEIKKLLIEKDKSKFKELHKFVIPEKYQEELYEEFKRICRKSKNFDEFLKLYINNDVFENTQGAYEIYKNFFPDNLWYRIRSIFGNNCKKAFSDTGCLKIGNDDFCFSVTNGKGDGVTRFALNTDQNTSYSNWFGNKVECSFSVNKEKTVFVYDFDCKGTHIETIPVGKYFVYAWQGLVLIEKYD